MKKILIIEDEKPLSEALKEALTQKGYSVEVASNGADGLKSMEESQPDLVTLDLMMPGMTGSEVLDAMRQNSKLANIPVIVMTNLDEHEEVVKTLKKGPQLYMVKASTKLEDILKQVNSLLEK